MNKNYLSQIFHDDVLTVKQLPLLHVLWMFPILSSPISNMYGFLIYYYQIIFFYASNYKFMEQAH